MKKKKIGVRLSVMVAISVLCTAAVVFGTTFTMLFRIINDNFHELAEDNVKVIETEIQGYLNSADITAKSLAESLSAQSVEDLRTRNAEGILKTVDTFYNATNPKSNNITITDGTGTVICRYYSDKKDDSIADQTYIQEALAGNSTTAVAQGTNIQLGARTGVPVKDPATGEIVGVVSVTFPLDKEEVIDEIKGDTEDVDFTIFKDNVRVNTTITNNGERAVGTEMDPEIAKTVLEDQKIYSGRNEIFGTAYAVAYSPLINSSGESIGALFAGVDLTESNSNLLFAIIICAAVAVLMIVLSIVYIIIFVNKSVVRPVNSLVTVASELASGNLSVSVGKIPNNEIGELGDSLSETINNLQAYIVDISDNMNAIANGDMTREITRDYVGDFIGIKDSINKISKSLNDTLSSINIAAEQVNAGAEQVATAAQSLSQGATEQASSVEQLSGSIMQVSEKINQTAKNVNDAGGYVHESEEGIQSSNQYMHQMMAAMKDINESSTQISKIIKVIDDIAFQTNILALNAAVEAARAGAAGKGFSVVADEVRNLASKSADAANQTTALIESSVANVNRGMEIAQETAKALEAVKNQAQMVTETIKQIQRDSNEQAEAINQITIGVEQISSVVQTNSATSQQSAAASEELSGQAQMLQEEISQFKLSGASFDSRPSSFEPAPAASNDEFTIDLDDDKY